MADVVQLSRVSSSRLLYHAFGRICTRHARYTPTRSIISSTLCYPSRSGETCLLAEKDYYGKAICC